MRLSPFIGTILLAVGCVHRSASESVVDRTAAALAEFEVYLGLARELELIAAEDHRELESLGGRALFYVCRLRVSLEPSKAQDGESGQSSPS